MFVLHLEVGNMTDVQGQRETEVMIDLDRAILEHVSSIAQFRHHVTDGEKYANSQHLPMGALAGIRAILTKELRLSAPDIAPLLPRYWREESNQVAMPHEKYYFEPVLLLQAFSGQETALREILARLHSEFTKAFEESARHTTG